MKRLIIAIMSVTVVAFIVLISQSSTETGWSSGGPVLEWIETPLDDEQRADVERKGAADAEEDWRSGRIASFEKDGLFFYYVGGRHLPTGLTSWHRAHLEAYNSRKCAIIAERGFPNKPSVSPRLLLNYLNSTDEVEVSRLPRLVGNRFNLEQIDGGFRLTVKDGLPVCTVNEVTGERKREVMDETWTIKGRSANDRVAVFVLSDRDDSVIVRSGRWRVIAYDKHGTMIGYLLRNVDIPEVDWAFVENTKSK